MEQLQNYIDAIVRTDWVTTAISAVVILAITAVVARLTRRFLGRVLAINEERDLPSSSIFINIARGAVWITGVCIMLSTCFRVDVSAAITALGIGGIAISLGFQDTLSNLIGGLPGQPAAHHQTRRQHRGGLVHRRGERHHLAPHHHTQRRGRGSAHP